MKKLIFFLSFLASYSIWALHPKLDKVVRLTEHCLKAERILLCDDSIDDELQSVHMDARGEFVYFLKNYLQQNASEKVVSNLYIKIQSMIPYYEKLDGEESWSTRDLKMLLGDVSGRYVKMIKADAIFLKQLYKAQSVQNTRYKVLVAVLEKSEKVISKAEMKNLAEFGRFVKSYSQELGDDFYLQQLGSELVKRMSSK
jgi:hypothetical protein